MGISGTAHKNGTHDILITFPPISLRHKQTEHEVHPRNPTIINPAAHLL